MTTRPVVIDPAISIPDAARAMTGGRFRHLPVVGDDDGAGRCHRRSGDEVNGGVMEITANAPGGARQPVTVRLVGGQAMREFLVERTTTRTSASSPCT